MLFLCVTTCGLYALATRHDYRQTFVGELLLEQRLHFCMVPWQGIDGHEMFRAYTQAEADFFYFAGSLGFLSACHAGGQVVGDYDGHRGVFVTGIQQSGHT